MEITREKLNNITILGLNGKLDTNASALLERKLLELIDSNEHTILIDFAQLDFISSSGLRVLLMVAKKLKALNGKLALCTLKSHVKEVFDIAGFTMIFSIFSSREDAIEDLQ